MFEIPKIFDYFDEKPVLETISDIVKVITIIYKKQDICLVNNITFLLITLRKHNFKLVDHSITVFTNSKQFLE